MNFDRMLGSGLVDSIVDSVTAPVQDWLAVHPLWNWLFTHPVWLIVAGVISIFLFAGLLQAIGQLTVWLWLGILGLPVRLVRWIFWGVMQLVLSLLGINKRNAAQSAKAQQQQRLADILQQLDALKQEQDKLLQEMKALLTNQPTLKLLPAQTSDNDSAEPSSEEPIDRVIV